MTPTHLMFALAMAYILRLPRIPTAIAGIIPDLDGILDYGFPLMHRGLVHTPMFLFLCMGVIAVVTKNKPLAAGFGVGFLAHLLTDIITPTGIMFFYPWPYFISLNIVYYNSLFGNISIIILSLTTILLYNSKWFKNEISSRFDIKLGGNI